MNFAGVFHKKSSTLNSSSLQRLSGGLSACRVRDDHQTDPRSCYVNRHAHHTSLATVPQSECGTVFKMFDWNPWNAAVLLIKDLGQTCVPQNLYLHSQVQKVSWPVITPIPAIAHHLSASSTCSPVPTYLSIPAIHIPAHFHLLSVRESNVFLCKCFKCFICRVSCPLHAFLHTCTAALTSEAQWV